MEMQYKCDVEVHGTPIAGWALSKDIKLDDKSIVYSLGVGDDISFDLSLIKKYGLTVFAFDPSPNSIAWLEKKRADGRIPEKFVFFPIAVSGNDGELDLFPSGISGRSSMSKFKRKELIEKYTVPTEKISSIMKRLGHIDKVDVLKMDIEGAEYEVINDMIENNIRPKQLLIEFHHHIPPITLSKTKRYVRKLNKYGYKIFHQVRFHFKELCFIVDK